MIIYISTETKVTEPTYIVSLQKFLESLFLAAGIIITVVFPPYGPSYHYVRITGMEGFQICRFERESERVRLDQSVLPLWIFGSTAERMYSKRWLQIRTL